LAGVLAAVAVAAWATVAGAAQAHADEIGALRIATVAAPLDPLARRGKAIAVRYAVAAAARPHAGGDPIFVVEGLGESGVEAAPAGLLQSLAALRQDHDLVFVDQRGVAGAGRLDCPAADPAAGAFAPERLEPCARRFDPALLRSLNANTFAADLEAVRRRLGYRRIMLVGYFYGARIAMAYLGRWPQHVSATALTDVGSPAVPTAIATLRAAEPAVRETLAACRAAPACQALYPDLAGDYARLLQRLDTPRLALAGPSESGGVVDGRALLSFVVNRAFRRRTAAAWPAMVHDLAQGRGAETLAAYSTFRREVLAAYPLAERLSVECAEDFDRPAEIAWTPGAAVLAASGDGVAAEMRACRSWPHGRVRLAAPRGDTPVLAITGESDVAGSPAETRKALSGLRRAQLVVLPGRARAADGDWDACVGPLVTAFLSAPRRKVDSGCAERVAHPEPAPPPSPGGSQAAAQIPRAPVPAPGGQVAQAPCPPLVPAAWRCLTVQVPGRYDSPSAPPAEVRVVVAPARHPKPSPRAVFLLQGGPGGSGTLVAGRGFVESIGGLQEDHDLVVVDQRAVSGAEALTCPPAGAMEGLARFAPDPLSPGPLAACRARSAARYDLATLTTAAFAEDLETVRRTLGYPAVEFYTGGYGGRIAQQYIRTHRDHVLGAVLADIGPMDDPIAANAEAYEARAVAAVLRACRRDWACARAYPRIEADYAGLKQEMRREGGLRAQVKADGRGETVLIAAQSVGSYFTAQFHFMAQVAELPFEIHALAAGGAARGRIAADILAYQRSVYEGVAVGEWLAVRCAEDEPLARPAPAGNPRRRALSTICRQGRWGRPPVGFHAPLRTDVPILLLTSPIAPADPTEEGVKAARGFSHVRVVEAANHGHVFDDDWKACLGPQAERFLETLDLTGLDTACAGRFKFRPFKLPE
jgi:pimeloyl-ACP methyl ester carboxylesterase